MAFQALYRKWRSQTFDELVGQEHAVKTLRNAIAADRVGHAYLFTGPRGVGKTTVARLLAKAVNCEASLTERPCNQCEPCRSITEGRSVDVIEMDAASNRGVDDAREIIERVQFRPAHHRLKVYIVDEVHMLTTEAFNALLKTLEEPPPHAMFILATTEVHKVPATIASRCQRFVFNRHSIQDMVAHLQHVAQGEAIELSAEAAQAIARAATGSLRDAVSILDQLMAYGETAISAEMVRALLGASAAEEVYEVIEALVASDITAALRAINAVADQGADLRQFARDLVDELRTLLLLKSGADRALIDARDESLPRLEELASQVEMAQLLAWLKLFSTLDHQLRISPYGQLPLELAAVEALIAPQQAAVPAEVAATRVTSGPSRSAQRLKPPQPQPKGETTKAPPAEPPASSVPEPSTELAGSQRPAEAHAHQAKPATEESEPAPALVSSAAESLLQADRQAAEEDPGSDVLLVRIEEQWDEIVEDSSPVSPTVQALLRSCEPISIEDAIVVIGAPSPFHRDSLEKQQHRRIVERVLSKVLGRTLGVRCELISNAEQASHRDARRQREELLRDPVVKAARNIFDATIVGVQREDDSS